MSRVGTTGNDTFVSSTNSDAIDGLAGIDTVDYSAALGGVYATVNGAVAKTIAGVNVTSVPNVADIASTDVLTDVENVYGSRFSDVLIGDSGDNTFRTGSGSDTVTGGGGVDTVDYTAAIGGVDVTVTGTGHTVTEFGLRTTYAGGTGGTVGTDTLTGISKIVGSSYDDRFTGGTGADNFDGGAGNDLLSGGAGNDVLAGGAGDDVLIGGAGADSLNGGIGIDTASYAGSASAVTINRATNVHAGDAAGDTFSYIERFVLTGNADSFTGNSTSEVVDGGIGNDALNGGGGNDVLIGGAGADAMNGGTGVDIASYITASSVTINRTTGVNTGHAAGDTFTSIEQFVLSNGADTFTGNSENEHITGGLGNDTIDGAGGDDILIGGAGADALTGGLGVDTAMFVDTKNGVTVNLTNGALNTGEAAGDTYSGIERFVLTVRNDSFTGTSAVDTVDGNAGADVLNGGAGDDVLTGGLGADILNGGADNDTLSGGSDDDRLSGATGDDILDGGSGDDVLIGGAGADVLKGGSGIDTASYATATTGMTVNLVTNTLTGDGAGDTLTSIERFVLTNLVDSFTGSIGDDYVDGGDGNDTLSGGDGKDFLRGGLGNDSLNGGLGDDILLADNDDTDANLIGGGGFDTLRFDGTGQGNFVLTNTNGIERVELGVGGGVVDANAVTTAMMLVGSTGNDLLIGGSAADTIIGGAGTNSMRGNGGADTFVLSTAAVGNTIDDYTDGVDKIDLRAFGTNFTSLQTAMVGSDGVIGIGGKTVAVLTGVNVSTLDASDFIFA